MTTGCACPRCGFGLAPSREEQCRICDEKDMTPFGRAIARLLDRTIWGEPLTINSGWRRPVNQKQRMP
jgi:hypothetical protein